MNVRSGVLTCDGMDEAWFKHLKKKAGVTNAEIAAKLGRDHTVISKLVSGQQRMTLEWAKVFSDALDVPVAEVLEKFEVGIGFSDAPPQFRQTGFSESDVVPFAPKQAEDRHVGDLANAFGARPGVDVWQVKSAALSFMGYMPGDFMLVDTHAAERVRTGDVVVAQIYDNASGSASTALRRYEPPVLVAASPDPEDRRVNVVDGVNVVIRGRVVASWRAM